MLSLREKGETAANMWETVLKTGIDWAKKYLVEYLTPVKLAMIVGLFWAGVTWVWGLPGPIVMTLALLAFAIVYVLRAFPNRGTWEKQQELERVQQALIELKAKLAALEDRRPFLRMQALVVDRLLTHAQQPALPPGVMYAGTSDSLVSLALLRVTNTPESLNSQAVARDVYARLYFYDSQWGKEIFPEVSGVWIEESVQKAGPFVIGNITTQCPDLKPYQSACLGVAMGYFHRTPQEWSAITARSPSLVDWFDADVLLNGKGKEINIKVVVGCHEFRTACYYLLRIDEVGKTFSLECTSHPLHIQHRTPPQREIPAKPEISKNR